MSVEEVSALFKKTHEIQRERYEMLDGKHHYWMSPRPDYGLVIFGETFDLEAFLVENIAAWGPHEAQQEHEMLKESLRRGYMFGKAYSVACPRGELGSTHVTRAMKISTGLFEKARSNGWELSRDSYKIILGLT